MKCTAIVVMFALASTNAGLVLYAGLPYAASPLLTRTVPAISQFSHVDYIAVPVVLLSTYAHAFPEVSQYSHVDYASVPVAIRLAAPYAAYTTVHKPAVPAVTTVQTRHITPVEGHEFFKKSVNVVSAPERW